MTQIINYPYDGDANHLQSIINSLVPGNVLEVDGGDYQLTQPLEINCRGTEDLPIWISSDYGAKLIQKNTELPAVTIGEKSAVRYLNLDAFQVEGVVSNPELNATGIKLFDVEESTISNNHIHNVNGHGIRNILANRKNINLIGNVIHDVGMGGLSLFNALHWLVTRNRIYNCNSPSISDGLLLWGDSYGCHISANLIYNTHWCCLRFFRGPLGYPKPVNVIERNILYNSDDNVLQAEGGDATVINNLILGPAGNKLFDSSHNPTTLRRLKVIHNTFLGVNGANYAVGLNAWNGQQELVFANNAVYIQPPGTGGYYPFTIQVPHGNLAGTFKGNVIYGMNPNLTSGFINGSGLGDFENIKSWGYSFSNLPDARPSRNGRLIGSGDSLFAALNDLTGNPRKGSLESGCLDKSRL